MTREILMQKIVNLISMAMLNDWDIEYIIENIERLIETYRLIENS